MTLILQITEPGKEPRTAKAEAGAQIGRSRECQVVLEDRKVGRKHFQIVEHDGALCLLDEASKNGTRVDGQEVARNQPMPIRDGMKICVGDTTLVTSLSSAAAAPGNAESGDHTVTRAVGRQRPSPGVPTPPPSADEGTKVSPRPRRPMAGTPPAPVDAAPIDEGTRVAPRPRRPAAGPAADDREGAANNGGNTVQSVRPRAGGRPPGSTPPANDGGKTMQSARPRRPAAGPPAAAANPQEEASSGIEVPAAEVPAAEVPAAEVPATPEPPAPAPTAETMDVRARRATLILVNPNLQTTKGVPTTPFRIGRQEDQSWCIPDDRISREHAVLDFDGSDFTLQDCGSRSGTTVADTALGARQSTRLADGERFALGPLDFYFFLDTEEKRAKRAGHHRATVQHLVKSKKLSKVAANRILNQAKRGERDAAELCLQEGEITVADWVDAGKIAKPSGKTTPIVIALIVLAGAVLGYLKWKDML